MLTGEKVGSGPHSAASLMLLMFTYFDVVSRAHREGGVMLQIMRLQCSLMFINCFSSLQSNLDFNRILSCQHSVFSNRDGENAYIKINSRNYNPNVFANFAMQELSSPGKSVHII